MAARGRTITPDIGNWFGSLFPRYTISPSPSISYILKYLIIGGVLARWAVARAIYPYMVSIGLVYFTTLSLYPGIASEVPSCRLGTWMPIVLMSAFNFFDFIGKVKSFMNHSMI